MLPGRDGIESGPVFPRFPSARVPVCARARPWEVGSENSARSLPRASPHVSSLPQASPLDP